MRDVFEALRDDFVAIAGLLQSMRNINDQEMSEKLQKILKQESANDHLIYYPVYSKNKLN